MSSMSRAVAPVVSTILMVAIAVILAAVLSVFALGFTEDVDDAAPVVGQSSGALENGSSNDKQIVTIRHIAGDTVAVENMEVAVGVTCRGGTKRGRLVDLPLQSNTISYGSNENIEGDDIFDTRIGGGPDVELAALTRESFQAGDKIEFRIPDNKCAIPQGGTVTVRVIHVPTNAVVITQELTAR